MRLVRAIAGACLSIAVGCSSADESAAGFANLQRLVPVEVKAPGSAEAWRLFDRSLASGLELGERAEVTVLLDSAQEVRALKVAGPAAYRLEVLDDSGAALPGADFDLAALPD